MKIYAILSALTAFAALAAADAGIPSESEAAAEAQPVVEELDGGLKIKHIVRKECKRKTKNGDSISMNYTGKLRDGSVFDSSLNPGREPLQFVLGTGRVIQGWDKGLLDMCIGDQRELSIPYQLAYGENGMPPVIPPKAELIFTTELKAISGVKEGKDEL